MKGSGPYLLIAALLVAFFALRIVAPAETIWSGDLPRYYYPLYEAVYQRMAAGMLPLWDPYELCGVPLFATLQGGFWYPPHIVYVLLPTHVALGVSALLHLFVAGFGMAALARKLGLGSAAVVLAATLFAIRGSVPAHVYHPNLMESAAWLAPGAVAICGIAGGVGARSAVALALALGLSLLAGYPQATLYCVYTWGALLVVLLARQRATATHSARALGAFALAGAAGVLLAGVQVFPAVELLSEGTRSLQALPLHAPAEATLRAAITNLIMSRNVNPYLTWTFGVVGMTLLPVALFDRRNRLLSLGLVAIGLVALGFVLGPVTPIFQLVASLPLVGSFRFPERVLFVAEFCFALTAACGLDALSRARLGGVGARRVGTQSVAGLVAIILATMAVVEIFSAPSRRAWLPYASREGSEFHGGAAGFFSFLSAQPERMWARLSSGVPEKAPMIFGARSVSGFEPLNLKRQAEYFTYFLHGRLEQHGRQPFSGLLEGFRRTPWDALPRRRLLDLAGVRYVIDGATLANKEFHASLLLNAHSKEGGLVLLENPRAIPRAFIAQSVQPAPPTEQLLAILSDDDFDPRVVSYVASNVRIDPVRITSGHRSTATIVIDEPHAVEIRTESSVPGLLVLSDTYYTGWQASIDGEVATIVRTNHLFRGVRLGAGKHSVRFEFRPPSFAWGIAATLLAAGLLTAFWFRGAHDSAAPRSS